MDKIKKARADALKYIPGGNSLLSKRAEMFSPDCWPTYFQSSSGIKTTDIDGNIFTDFSHFSVGTNILGYCDPDVNRAVVQCVQDGNMSTLNPIEEVQLAEKLVNMHPWSAQARFARTGGEANAIAVRIARASAKSDVVAICGYHGWHDWYLSANLSKSDVLSGHLLRGLSTSGVPSSLAGKTVTFPYGDLQILEDTVKLHNVGVIKMEVMRSFYPTKDYLLGVRRIADENDCILVFDECTSGFRETFGGLHLKYDVYPDLCVFGKALGNGYPITAVIGTKNIMENSQSTFISSSYFTDRIGFVAALNTLEKMEVVKSYDTITRYGEYFRNAIASLFNRFNLPVQIRGMYALTSISIDDEPLKFKTFVTEQMLQKGFLFSNLFYPSILHTPAEIDACIDALSEVLAHRQELMSQNAGEYFWGTICHSTFERIN